jgi:Ca2+-binding RTX toxin-like protein
LPKPVSNTQTESLTDFERGTNDLWHGSGTYFGDALDMYDNSVGGNDTLIGEALNNNFLYGDARSMYGNSAGGNDTLIGGDNAGLGLAKFANFLQGDALDMYDNSVGGNDTLIGGIGDSTINALYGDARGTVSEDLDFVERPVDGMSGNSVGGNDTLIGGNGAFRNSLVGDAHVMFGNAVGGNDTLIGGNGANTSNSLYGDARYMFDNAVGGNDRLISSTGTDNMWGDAQFINGVDASPTVPTGSVKTGADTFVFAPGSGVDYINDFRQSDHDHIDVSAYGFHSVTDMTITVVANDTVIAFDATNSVTLVGISDPSQLHASDFIFA